ncbi:MAG: hypothetical protein LBH95_09475 [Oscillospiraceae bacterium]|jgi:hypothetical protein|nr:hypothetical protein [Oscillospiraceae bacterium]
MFRKFLTVFLVSMMMLPMTATAAEDCFVLSRMPEYEEEYNALLSWLEPRSAELVGKNDSFLADKAYPAFLLANPLEPGKNIDVKLLRWEIPTEKNKLVSILPEKDGFRFLGMSAPLDETQKPSQLVDLDAVSKLTGDIPNARFTFINADEYNARFVQVESDNGTYLIPYTFDELTLGLRDGYLYSLEEALSRVCRPPGGGSAAPSSGNSFPAPLALIFGTGAVVCAAVYFATAKRKAKQE